MKYRARAERRERRHRRIRRKIRGTADRPRMAVAISNRYQYVQFIDDDRGVTLAAATTLRMDGLKNTVQAARVLGQRAAQAALAKGIRRVVIDRGGYRFHGRVRAIVEAAVEAGLQIRSSPEQNAELQEPERSPAGETT